MEKDSHLDNGALIPLGFWCDGDFWIHSQEKSFAVKLEPTFFYISYHGYLAKHPFNLTVGELEKQFFERTGKLLF